MFYTPASNEGDFRCPFPPWHLALSLSFIMVILGGVKWFESKILAYV